MKYPAICEEWLFKICLIDSLNSGVATSSQSTNKIQSIEHFSSAEFFCSTKPFHSSWNILQWNRSAIFTVSSDENESIKIISCNFWDSFKGSLNVFPFIFRNSKQRRDPPIIHFLEKNWFINFRKEILIKFHILNLLNINSIAFNYPKFLPGNLP